MTKLSTNSEVAARYRHLVGLARTTPQRARQGAPLSEAEEARYIKATQYYFEKLNSVNPVTIDEVAKLFKLKQTTLRNRIRLVRDLTKEEAS